MSPNSPTATLNFKPWLYWTVIALVIFAAKSWLALAHGLQLFPDSYNYLACIVHSDYPAGYPLFVHVVQGISESPTALIILQSACFAVAAAFLIWCLQFRKWWQLLAVLALTVEPISTIFCASVMSEALFIPILLTWTGAVLQQLRTGNLKWLIVAGLLGGIMYGVRFAGVIPAIIPVLVWLGRKQHRKQSLKWIPIYILVFQAVLLPLRWQNHKTFDTWQLNGLTGVNLWNNTAVLYKGSQVEQNPKTDFARFAGTGRSGMYTIKTSLYAAHIWSSDLPYRRYAKEKRYTFTNNFSLSKQAGQVGWELLLERPGGYLGLFVLPNIGHAFKVKLHGHPSPWEYPFESGNAVMQQELLISNGPWRIEFGILVLSSILFLIAKRRRISMQVEGWLMVLLWTYFLILPVITAINLRYLLTMNCLVILLFLGVIGNIVARQRSSGEGPS